MANLTLGLDLGTASIGWALIDEENGELHRCGVRIFPEGVDRDTSGAEKSKNETRRVARSTRRLLRRRSARNRKLKMILVEAGLLPEISIASRQDEQRQAWETEAFKQADPYELRRKGLDEKLEPHELGRVIMHLNQRRGFLSNRKTDRGNAKETEGMLGEISQLESDIKESGSRTLGEYLANLRSENTDEFHLTQIRGRHTRRSMYEEEFEIIWDAQQKHYAEILTDEFKAKVHNQIFFQRPIKPPSPSMVGRCEVLPRLARCPRADRRAQRFRLLLDVNNLRYIDMSKKDTFDLSDEQREKLIQYLMEGKERTFDQIRKHLFPQHANIRFNLEAGGRKKLLGMPVDAAIAAKGKKETVGKAWYKIDENLKDWIVAAIIDDDKSRLRTLLEQAGFDPMLSEVMLDNTPLPDGYMSYSLNAIKKMLPFVAQGMPLLSRDETVPCAYRAADFLPPWEREGDKSALLKEPPTVANPIVRAALHEVKKVVNSILRELVYKGDHQLTNIRIELAREAKGSVSMREEQSKNMRKNERERDAAKKWLEEHGYKTTYDAILRYRLWQQQGEQCVYSGKNISTNQLFGGEIDIDHILPVSRTLDDSQMNKVVCFKSENSLGASNNAKGNKTPYEWLSQTNPTKYDEVIQRAKKLPYPKLKRFYQKGIEDGFIERQLRDTTYITTQVKLYVDCLGAKVTSVKGQHTSKIRHLWGLDTILQELTDSPAWQAAQDLKPGEKNRLDHRHHTIDAIVVALTDAKRLQALAEVARQKRREEYGDHTVSSRTQRAEQQLEEPWHGFRLNVSDAISQINVSYRVRRKASGRLHEDTIYGKTENEGEFVVRKPLSALTPSTIDDIRDPVVKKKVEARLKEHGIKIGRGAAKIPPDIWAEPLWMNEEKEIRINKVRIVKREKTIEPIREGTAFVKPGNTHHLCLFEYTDAKGKTKRDAVFVTMIEAMKRIRNRESIIQRNHPDIPNAIFLFSISGNEMFSIEHKGEGDLYRYSRSASTSGQMWFKHHYAGGKSASKIGEISKSPNSLFEGEVQKVTVTPIGEIRWAND